MNPEHERALEAASLQAASETATVAGVLVIGLSGCLVGIGIGLAMGWLIWG